LHSDKHISCHVIFIIQKQYVTKLSLRRNIRFWEMCKIIKTQLRPKCGSPPFNHREKPPILGRRPATPPRPAAAPPWQNTIFCLNRRA